MFGLFLFLVIFVTLCLLISEPQSSSTPVQVTKTTDYTPKLVRTKAGAIPVRGFKPVGLLEQTQNGGVKPEETKSFATSENNIQHPQSSSSPENTDLTTGGAAVAGGATAGAAVVAAVGNMGLVGAFGGVGIGMAPVAIAGGVVGAAGYGAVKAVKDGDAVALGAVAGGGLAGAGVAGMVGNMGLAVAGGAVGVGAAPVIAVGALVGMAGYGLWRMFGGR
jgi:hypothetical protein